MPLFLTFRNLPSACTNTIVRSCVRSLTWVVVPIQEPGTGCQRSRPLAAARLMVASPRNWTMTISSVSSSPTATPRCAARKAALMASKSLATRTFSSNSGRRHRIGAAMSTAGHSRIDCDSASWFSKKSAAGWALISSSACVLPSIRDSKVA